SWPWQSTRQQQHHRYPNRPPGQEQQLPSTPAASALHHPGSDGLRPSWPAHPGENGLYTVRALQSRVFVLAFLLAAHHGGTVTSDSESALPFPPKDFHLRVAVHSGRTKKRARGYGHA